MDKVSRSNKKNIFLIGIFIILFFVIDNILGFGLKYLAVKNKPDMNALMWNDFYSQKKNTVDAIFIGSSHARFAFDTRIFDKDLNMKTFNLSSADQTPVMGYFALKEALRYQKPKILVYEAYWRKFGTDDNTTPAYFVYDYIKGINVKLGILSSLYGDKNFYPFLQQALSKTYKYRENFIPIAKDLLKGNLLKQENDSTRQITFGDYKYYKNGYFGSDIEASYENLYIKNPFKNSSFSWNAKQIEYFKKTLKLCKENNIKFLVVTAPLPIPTMDFVKGYDSCSKVISDISREFNAKYIDFNIENRNTKIFNNKLFLDSNHLNSNGAKTLEKLLAPAIKECLGSNQ